MNGEFNMKNEYQNLQRTPENLNENKKKKWRSEWFFEGKSIENALILPRTHDSDGDFMKNIDRNGRK